MSTSSFRPLIIISGIWSGVVVFLLALSVGRLFRSTGVKQILFFYPPVTYEVGLW